MSKFLEKKELFEWFVEKWKGLREMRIYISGFVSDTDDCVERFKEVEEKLKRVGADVVNPLRVNLDVMENATYEEYMSIFLCLLGMCDAIYMMDGWENSCVANREHDYAVSEGKAIIFETSPFSERMRSEEIGKILESNPYF